MWWVVVALVCLLLLILLALCIPLDLIVNVNTNHKTRYRVRLLWLFGLVDHEFKRTEKKKNKQEQAQARPKEQKSHIDASTIYRILRIQGLWTQLKRLITGIYKSLKIKELTAHLKLGLENPADIGILFAIAGPLNFFLSLLPYEITMWPTFDSEIALEAYVHSIARLYPILVILALLKFAFSLPTIRIAQIFIMSRWKEAR